MLLWLLVSFTVIAIYWRFYRKHPHLQPQKGFNIPVSSGILLSGLGLIAIALGILAIAAAPNHSDSMEYHMSRVVHWIQNASVAHYPTHTIFQLYQNPWSEFAIMHFQILTNSDRFANLIQWGSMVGSLIGVSLIAKNLGASLKGQILAAVFCATIPMGILQATSTNNDYVVGFWLVCFAYFTLITLKTGATPENLFRLGSSLGLAVLTKGTAYIYALPFCIWIGLWGIKTLRWKAWKPFLIITLLFLAINLGHYTRNFALFASPLGVPSDETNQEFSWAIFVSGIIRNLSLHADIVRNLWLEKFITPTTGLTNKVVEIIHGFLGLDVSDPRITSPKVKGFYVPSLSLYEDTAGNPFHLLLIMLSLGILIVRDRLRKQPYLIAYSFCVLSGFLLFCFLLTWSPYRCRLHLPLFILFSAVVGVVFSKTFHAKINYVLALLLLFLSHSWVLNNSVRPFLGENSIFKTPRIEQYFNTQKGLQSGYLQAVETVEAQNCTQVGLLLENTSFEYPLWRGFQQDHRSIVLRHIGVRNESAVKAESLPYRIFKPCTVIYINGKEKKQPPQIRIDGQQYRESWSEESDQKRTISVLAAP
ncbi:hypothetical protein PJF56_16015 [Roseofilum sp. BLCC_M91]|uniref:Glycosyltransferase RgtA/B/C/D-like domain-containing protein n=1 Tax=Roseofilum halophilum BLCC-M91 TaxID=3022259 RepID=A0ABT7BMH6_9CYAN|nr:hypothetical protein [Roseofilum halophilum]MDJ1180371.1 hypothetical protein [Roseofilum halophilum BLCC-M91]